MKPFKPDQVWEPQHVILGGKVSDLPLTDPYVQFELHDAGVNSSITRSRLCLAAAFATSAIRKMLACETQ